MIVKGLLIATLAWGSLAFGGVYAWAYQPLLVGAALTGLAAWWLADSNAIHGTLAGAAAIIIAAVSLQLVPLPPSVIMRLSPATHRVLNEVQIGYGSEATRHPLSVAPSMTAIAVVFLIVMTTYVIGVAQWLTRERMQFVAAVIVILGTFMAVEGLIQRMLSPTLIYGQPALIYGFWQPTYGRDPYGPFVNKNHFGGWMLMGVPIAVGLTVGLVVRQVPSRQRDWRSLVLRLADPSLNKALLTAFCALMMTVALMSTQSRSAISAALVTLTLGSLMAGRARSARTAWYLTVVIAFAILMAAILTGADALAARFAALDSAVFDTRLALWADAVRIVGDAPITGIGIRAYSTASLVYQTALPEFHVGAAHNDWLQLIAEGGLLVGIPALFLVTVLIRQAMARFAEHRLGEDFGTTYWIRVGAALGLVAIGTQSFVEFSLQMPGNTVMFGTLWAMTIASCGAQTSKMSKRP